MHLSGEELVHHCHHVSVQINMMLFVVLLVQPLLLMLLITGSMGNVQVRGFMLDEHGPLRSSAGLCVA